MNIFWAIRQELRQPFSSDDGDAPDLPRSPVSLHTAVRRVVGAHPSWALVAYWNHRELTVLVEAVHAVLDDILSARLGRRTQAIGWSLQSERIDLDVVELLYEAEAASPDLTSITAIPRVRMQGMPAAGKPRNVICTELAHLYQQPGSAPYVEAIRSIVGECESVKNADIIDHLDNRLIGTYPARRSLKPEVIALSLCSRWGESLKHPSRENFAVFMADVWAGDQPANLSDEWLLQRLAAPIPQRLSTLDLTQPI